MKALTVLIALTVLTGTVNANEVVCKKDGRFWRPANETAKEIAESLGVKTCNGKRFKDVVSKLGYKSNVKATKKRESVEDIVARLKK